VQKIPVEGNGTETEVEVIFSSLSSFEFFADIVVTPGIAIQD